MAVNGDIEQAKKLTLPQVRCLVQEADSDAGTKRKGWSSKQKDEWLAALLTYLSGPVLPFSWPAELQSNKPEASCAAGSNTRPVANTGATAGSSLPYASFLDYLKALQAASSTTSTDYEMAEATTAPATSAVRPLAHSTSTNPTAVPTIPTASAQANPASATQSLPLNAEENSSTGTDMICE